MKDNERSCRQLYHNQAITFCSHSVLRVLRFLISLIKKDGKTKFDQVEVRQSYQQTTVEQQQEMIKFSPDDALSEN